MKMKFTKWSMAIALFAMTLLLPLEVTAKKLYLDAGGNSLWDQGGAWFSAWVWGSQQSDAWYKATKGDVYYEIDVPDDATGMKWVRFSNVATTESWTKAEGQSDGYWNQTGDLKIPTDGMNKFTITDWNDQTTGWSTYTSPTPDPDPDQPVDPEDPDTPVDPEDPDQPVDPEDPDTPVEPATQITITYVNTEGYESVYMHAWGGTAAATSWPGQLLTASGQQINGYDTYTFTFDEGAYANCLFNCGGTNPDACKTVDQTIDPAKTYFSEGFWYATEAEIPADVPDVWTVVGAEGLFETAWNFGNTAYDMTEGEAGIFTLVKEGVVLEAKSYEYKFIMNRSWMGAQYPAEGNYSLTVDEAATYNVTYTLDTNAGNGTCTIEKVTSPEPEPTPEITVSETEVDFGELTVGEQANEEVTYTYKDTEKPEISLVGNGFSYTDNELSIIITFAPVDAGEYEGTLTVGKAELAKTITLKGTAKEAEKPVDPVSNLVIPEFAETTVGETTTVTATFDVNNAVGLAPQLLDNPSGYFTMGTPVYPDGGVGQASIEITFAPKSAGTFSANLYMPYAGGGLVQQVFSATAVAGGEEPGPGPEPAKPVDNIVIPAFAETTVGQTTTVTATFDVNNVDGLVPQLLDNPSGYFTMGTPVYPDAGVGKASIDITFAPEEVGTFSANLYLAYAGGLAQQVFSATAVAGAPEPEPENVTVTFVNFEGWDAVKFHAWGGAAEGTEWSGIEMTKLEETLYDASIYTISFESGAYASCIFNDGAGTQTGNLTLNESKPVYANGVWYASLDDVPNPETAAAALWLKGDVNTWNGGDEWQFATTDGENYVLEFAEATALTGEFKIGGATFATYNFGAAEGEEAIAAGKAYTLVSGSLTNLVFAENLTASKIEFVLSTATLTITAATAPEPDPVSNIVIPAFAETTAGETSTVTATFDVYNVDGLSPQLLGENKDLFSLSTAVMPDGGEGQASIDITFAPEEAGTFNAILYLAYAGGVAQLDFSATAIAGSQEPKPELIVSAEEVVFETLYYGIEPVSATKTIKYTIENSDEDAVIALESEVFKAEDEDGTITITFTPETMGEYTAKLTITLGDIVKTVAISGTARPIIDDIMLPEFDDTKVGEYDEIEVLYTLNQGETATATLDGDEAFEITSQEVGSLFIRFTPLEVKEYTTTLILTADNTERRITLVANGLPADEEPELLTLYYVNNQGWEEVAAYAWDVNPIAEWPGELATKTDLTAKGYDVYSYTFDQSKATTIIFNNNGAGAQTDDLTIDPSKPYFYIDQWYASLEEIEELVSVEEVAAFAIYATNGTIYADCEFAIYNLIGIDVTAQNGSLNGKYIVKTEKGSKLISVW